MYKHILYVVTATLLATLLAAQIPSSAHAEAGGIGGHPATSDPKNDRTKSIFIHTIKAGDTVDDTVVVANNSGKTQTIDVYATDGIVTNTGAITCEQRAESADKAGSWIKLAKSEVTLESGRTEKVPFTITLPAGAKVGEHNACIAFQAREDGQQVSGNVRIRTRSAVRVAVTVPGNLQREVDIVSFGAQQNKESGNQDLLLRLKSSGNVSTDVSARVYLKTLLGTHVYSNEGIYPVLANNTFDVLFTSDGKLFWGGLYKAEASIYYNNDPSKFGFDSGSDVTVKDAKAVYVFAKPAPVAIGAYAALFVGLTSLAGVSGYRRHKLGEARNTWVAHTVKSTETLQTLADEYGIGWKKIAEVNHLKAPYAIKRGDKIKLPKKTKKD